MKNGMIESGKWLAALLIALFSSTPLQAGQDGRPQIIGVIMRQVIALEQSDASGSEHTYSSLAIDTFAPPTEGFDPQLIPGADFTLPAGAAGSVTTDDFTVIENGARFFQESTEIDGGNSFPEGEFSMGFRTPDDSCTFVYTFVRTLQIGDLSLRPRIINRDNWRAGKLCLPKGNLIVRWENIGEDLGVSGDTETRNSIEIRDEETGEIVYDSPTEGDGIGAIYPQLRFADQQGLDLSHVDSIVEGRTYVVKLRKELLAIWVSGNLEMKSEFGISTSFKLFVDPEAALPPKPKLLVTTDDAEKVFQLRWDPDIDHDYLILAGLDTFKASDGLQIPKITPAGPPEAHLFTKPIDREREFFHVLTIPK